MANYGGVDFKRKYMDGYDERELRLKRQHFMDSGSYFGASSGLGPMHNASYAYGSQPPPFPVVRVRGLPFDCVESDVLDFFHGLHILDILFVHKGGRFTGEAYCVLAYPLQVDFAIQRNMRNIGRRYIEVFRSNRHEYYSAVAQDVANTRGSPHRGASKARSNDDKKDLAEHTGVLRMRGLPYSAEKDDIMDFFRDYELSENNVHIVLNSEGRPSGEAYVEFASAEDSKSAMGKDKLQHLTQPATPGSSIQNHPELAFDRLQPCGEELLIGEKRAFGRFVARGALIDEEYWSAAWLRAEAQCESVSYMRHTESYRRKFADQEFYALKSRCAGRDGNSLKCRCIIAVKKEDPNVRRTVLNSVVGTLDLSIRQFLPGETFPGDFKKASSIFVSHEVCDSHRYAYIANVCVSKFARRQGIAYNMIYLATDVAISSGMKELFVHVNADNRPAWNLYKKTGFKMVEAASSPAAKDQMLLMHLQL